MLEHMVWPVISNYLWLCKYVGLLFGFVCPYFTGASVYICVCVYIDVCLKRSVIVVHWNKFEGFLERQCPTPAFLNIYGYLSRYLWISPQKTENLSEGIGTCRNTWVVGVGPLHADPVPSSQWCQAGKIQDPHSLPSQLELQMLQMH